MLTLETSVEKLIMVGPGYTDRLNRLGIKTIGDLLYHLPFRYQNYSLVSTIEKLQPGETVSLFARVVRIDTVYTKNGKKIQKAKVADTTGEIEVIWYNQPFLTKLLAPSTPVILSGKVETFASRKVLQSPEYEIQKSDQKPLHTARIVPMYPETEKISSKWLRSRIFTLLFKISISIEDELPHSLRDQYGLLPLRQALLHVHFPQTLEDAERARERLAFDELFFLQLQALMRKREWKKEELTQPLFTKRQLPKIKKITSRLPFQLTAAQRRAIREILADVSKTLPMNRLLVGDVGSGKTVVAAIAMYSAHLAGKRSLLLAPTEILARQHYDTIRTVLSPIEKDIALVSAKTKKRVSKSAAIFIGTHALLSDSLKIRNVGLVVVDEQQRFGVRQRAHLRLKGKNPHLLSMTATPIPRTIALTLFADLDVSFIDELPKGRVPVKTWVVPPEKRLLAYEWVKNQILQSGKKDQAFIICPFIDESETLTTVKAAKVEYERLKKEVFPDFALGLLHGELKEKKRQEILSLFRNGKSQILVSTPIVEVGIDIPGATMMMIEGADRFGLSQLHQLRGRVGRGERNSYCLLFTDSTQEQTIRRLTHLTKVANGPELAELDMKERGSGDIFGVAQHGHLGLRIATLSDGALFTQTFDAAKKLLEEDPQLLRFPLLRKKLEEPTIEEIAPD